MSIENDTDEILTILEDGDLAYPEIFQAKYRSKAESVKKTKKNTPLIKIPRKSFSTKSNNLEKKLYLKENNNLKKNVHTKC